MEILEYIFTLYTHLFKIKRRDAVLGQIINADMPDPMREAAIEIAMKAMDRYREKGEYQKVLLSCD